MNLPRKDITVHLILQHYHLPLCPCKGSAFRCFRNYPRRGWPWTRSARLKAAREIAYEVLGVKAMSDGETLRSVGEIVALMITGCELPLLPSAQDFSELGFRFSFGTLSREFSASREAEAVPRYHQCPRVNPLCDAML